MDVVDNIYINIEAVRMRIIAAAQRAGRNPGEITLIAAGKRQTAKTIQIAVDCGLYNIGENRSQELVEKHDHVTGGVIWHFIGQLQRNKVKYVVSRLGDTAGLVQSLDRLALAEEIDRQAREAGVIVRCLAQVNLGTTEGQRGGLEPGAVEKFLDSLQARKNIKLCGLMILPPPDYDNAREYLRQGRQLFETCQKDCPGMEILSMGMSDDYEIAIEEGSTMVRVGTAIFGQRTNNA